MCDVKGLIVKLKVALREDFHVNLVSETLMTLNGNLHSIACFWTLLLNFAQLTFTKNFCIELTFLDKKISFEKKAGERLKNNA